MTNEYLQHLLDFEESEVPYYKKKIALFISGGYSHILSAFIINYLASLVGAFIVGMMISEGLNFGELIMDMILLAVSMIICYAVSFKSGKKRMHKYIDINHGELGHRRGKMYKKIKSKGTLLMLLTVALAAVIAFIRFGLGVDNLIVLDTMDVLHYAVVLIGSVAFYFFGAVSYCNEAKLCPYCGRINTFSVKKLSSIGSKFEGYSTSISSRTAKVGTRYTTTKTTYSDGSATYSTSSSPIYGTVYTEHTYENSSTIDSYLYYCTECPGTETSTELEMHKKEVARREL